MDQPFINSDGALGGTATPLVAETPTFDYHCRTASDSGRRTDTVGPKLFYLPQSAPQATGLFHAVSKPAAWPGAAAEKHRHGH
ncbi:MAG: hypothetical protein LIP23_03585 [Planctomycetes bacterium]|nr:hypothetical protein [Planctomycetota bacterium]